jgi:2-polyprenyl-3-methyl-5-hydroxy-6-metoxy-1,4-benzoquinol methylase
MSFFREMLEEWISEIEVTADSVLDIGGAANPIKDRVKSWNVNTYLIADNLIEQANSLDSEIVHYDLNERGVLDTTDWDVIFCLEVFEYVFNPVAAMHNISDMLGDEGIAYISFPSIYPVHEPKEYDYLRYTKQGIIRLLDFEGFSDWVITPRIATAGREELLRFYALEGMHPVKHDTVIEDIGYLVKAVK